MQPIIESGSPVKYNWNQISPTGLSLKNSSSFRMMGRDWMAATDMVRGGTAILRLDVDGWKEHMLCYPQWIMMWAPYPYIDSTGKLWIYCCDTGGGDLSHWWDFMRIKRHWVDLNNKTWGPLESVVTPVDSHGIIDPALMQIGEWWYLFYVDLWNGETQEWWDPCYSVSRSPAGPFVGSVNLQAPERGIDEACKPFRGHDGKLLVTWSSGDSGIDGGAYLGELTATGQHPDGWLYFRINPKSQLKSSVGSLCTAIDPGAWPLLRCTLRNPGYPSGDLRGNFCIGELS